MAEKKKHKWVKQVVGEMHKGALRKKAEHAGESTAAYAREHEHDEGKTGKQSRLAESLMAMSRAHKKHSTSNKKIRESLYS